jgi:hypothetical protein
LKKKKNPCLDLNEATKRERYNVELFNSVLKSQIPSRTQKEYAYEYKKTYYENYSDKI